MNLPLFDRKRERCWRTYAFATVFGQKVAASGLFAGFVFAGEFLLIAGRVVDVNPAIALLNALRGLRQRAQPGSRCADLHGSAIPGMLLSNRSDYPSYITSYHISPHHHIHCHPSSYRIAMATQIAWIRAPTAAARRPVRTMGGGVSVGVWVCRVRG
jgi:hypothetical protein